MVRTTLITLAAKRVPMIRFRNGANAFAQHSSSAVGGGGGESSTAKTASSSVQKSQPASSAQYVIEDWELPARYHRKPIAQDEMDYINRGGPA